MVANEENAGVERPCDGLDRGEGRFAGLQVDTRCSVHRRLLLDGLGETMEVMLNSKSTARGRNPLGRNRQSAAAARDALAPFAALVAGAVAMVRVADLCPPRRRRPFASAFWRVALALPLLYAWTRLSDAREPTAYSSREPRSCPGLAFSGDLFFWHLAIVHTSVANATFFATAAPIWVVLFGWFLFRRRATAGVLAGLGLCLIGGTALLAQRFELKPAGALGDVFGIATGVFFGLYFLAVQAARKTASAARLTFEATLITAAILFVVAFTAERSMLPHTIRASRPSSQWLGSATAAGRPSCRLRSAICRPLSPRS